MINVNEASSMVGKRGVVTSTNREKQKVSVRLKSGTVMPSQSFANFVQNPAANAAAQISVSAESKKAAMKAPKKAAKSVKAVKKPVKSKPRSKRASASIPVSSGAVFSVGDRVVKIKGVGSGDEGIVIAIKEEGEKVEVRASSTGKVWRLQSRLNFVLSAEYHFAGEKKMNTKSKVIGDKKAIHLRRVSGPRESRLDDVSADSEMKVVANWKERLFTWLDPVVAKKGGAGPVVRLMSWNVATLTYPGDGAASKRDDRRIQFIAETIAAASPSVLLLQEVGCVCIIVNVNT